MPLPEPLLSNPPSLSEQLRCRTEQLRSRIIRGNYNTQFAQIAPELVEFRNAMTGVAVDKTDDDVLSESFRKMVRFTTYDSYAPFVARFFETPCRANAVVDLLAPGLPDLLGRSSATSGGPQKFFPRYNLIGKMKFSEASQITDPLQRRTRAYVRWLAYERINITDEDSNLVKTVYATAASVISPRTRFHLDPAKDEEIMATFVHDHVAPYAAGFIYKWRSFLLIHVLFALCSRSLERMNMVFIYAFVDMMRHLDTEFDMVVDCIENGTIPDLEGIDRVRQYLEVNISADPERAAELRDLGRPSSRPGWCGHVWPNLHSITASSGGPFASSVPVAEWFLGPSAHIHANLYGSTEGQVGLPYSPLELNQFKMCHNNIVEFLDISRSDSISSLAQPWEVEHGKRYEVVLTTPDGLWRYRLADVVEISGFDPTDGSPIMQIIKRRNVALRLLHCMFSEEELKIAMSCLSQSIPTNVINWTATTDDRRVPATIGFFVELANQQVSESDLALAAEHVFDELKRSNAAIPRAIGRDLFRQPTIRLVRPGTFSDFLQLKCDEGTKNLGQLKVPIVLPKASYVRWFSCRAMREF